MADLINFTIDGQALQSPPGTLLINAAKAAGIDTVRVNDPSGFMGSYTVTATQVTRSSGFSMTYAAENLTLNGGFFGDTFDIRSTAIGTKTTVSGSTGSDTFRVGNEANTLDGIQGTLILDGGVNGEGLEDQVTFADQGSTVARSYTFRADQYLARTGSAMIGYGGMERLTLNAGNSADSVAVVATAPGTPVVLNMGAGNDRVTIGSVATHGLSAIAVPVIDVRDDEDGIHASPVASGIRLASHCGEVLGQDRCRIAHRHGSAVIEP